MISTSYSWNDGILEQDWNVNSNWSPVGIPNSFTDSVSFTTKPTNDLSITLNSNISLNALTFSCANHVTLFGGEEGAVGKILTFGGITPKILSTGTIESLECDLILNMNSSLEINTNAAGGVIYLRNVTGNGDLTLKGASPIYFFPFRILPSTYTGKTIIDGGHVIYGDIGAFPTNNFVTITNNGHLLMDSIGDLTSEQVFNLELKNSGSLKIESDLFVQAITAEATCPIVINNVNPYDKRMLFHIEGTAADAQNIQGDISGGIASPSPDWSYTQKTLIMTEGTGTLFLSGNNTFVSRLFIGGGSTVQVKTVNSVGASGPNSPCFVLAGGVFELNPTNPINTFNKDLFLNGSGINGNGALKSLNQTNTLAGNVMIGWDNGSQEPAKDTTINVVNNSLTLSGIVAGNKNLTKTGNGSLILSGGTSNPFSGVTILNSGVLNLSKNPGPALSSIEVNDGSLLFGFADQLSTSARLTLNGGTTDFQNNNQTFGSLFYNQGSLNLGIAQLSLTSSDHAILLRNTTLSGTVFVTGAGDIRFDKTVSGTAQILGTLNLGTLDHTFDIDNGGSSVDMEVAALTSSTGKMIKEGLGTLEFSNNANFSSVEIAAGKLFASGSMTAPIVTVEHFGTLGGNGTLTGNVSVIGTLAPGESIGTTTVSGDVTFQDSSTFSVECNPSSHDLLKVIGGGKVTILPGSMIAIQPQPGSYPEEFEFTVIDAPGGVSGIFTKITNKTPLFSVFYHPQRVDLIRRRQLTLDISDGNPGSVAQALDHITPIPLSDMEEVIEDLEEIENVPLLRSYLNTMHPAIYKGMAMVEQKNSFCFRKTLVNRSDTSLPMPAFWIDLFSDFSSQKSQGELFGYKNFTPAGVIGFDGYAKDHVKFGGALGFCHSQVDMHKESGSGHINSLYGALYGSAYKAKLFFQGVLSGGYHYFHHIRNINLGENPRVAKSKNRGLEVGCYFSSGYYFKWKDFEMTPYLAIDDAYIRENEYEERGAEDLNLGIDESSYNVLKGEVGVHFSTYFEWKYFDLIPDLKLSILKPWRHGSHYTCHFVNYKDQEFVVTGQKPDYIIYSPALTLTLTRQEKFSCQVGYNGEFQKKYQNHMVNLQISCNF